MNVIPPALALAEILCIQLLHIAQMRYRSGNIRSSVNLKKIIQKRKKKKFWLNKLSAFVGTFPKGDTIC